MTGTTGHSMKFMEYSAWAILASQVEDHLPYKLLIITKYYLVMICYMICYLVMICCTNSTCAIESCQHVCQTPGGLNQRSKGTDVVTNPTILTVMLYQAVV